MTFKSNHSVAKYCSRVCSNKVNCANIVGAKRPRRHSDEELLGMLTALADSLGKTPSKRECTEHLGFQGFRDRFGSYNRAVELAGLMPNKPLPPSFDEDRKAVNISLRFTVLERDGFRCVYCGGTPGDGYVLHVDHIIPRALGGPTEEGNLATACSVCNEGKSARMLTTGE